MLEVQLVRRSRSGVAIPVARSDTPELVRDVANRILIEMRRWSFQDELLDDFARRERAALESILETEGVKDGN